MEADGFYVAVALEVDEDRAVVDVVYRGAHVAAVRATPGAPTVVTYDAEGVPLAGLIAALGYAQDRLAAES